MNSIRPALGILRAFMETLAVLVLFSLLPTAVLSAEQKPEAFAVSIDLLFRSSSGDVRIAEKIGCTPRDVHVPAFATGRSPTTAIRWIQSADHIARLHSGGRVLIRLPSICQRVKRGNHLDGFVPLVYWIDDARNPTFVEAIVYASAYRQETASGLTFVAMKVSRPEELRTPIELRRPEQITSKTASGHLAVDREGRPVSRGFDHVLEGVTAFIYPASVWSKDISLARHVRSISGVRQIPWDVMRKAGSLLKTCDRIQAGATLGIQCPDGLDRRMYAVPSSRTQNIWLVGERKFGREHFYVLDRYDPHKQGCTLQANSCSFERREFKVQIRDAVFTSHMPATTFWVFDSEAQELYFIYPSVFPATLLEQASK